MFETFFVAKVSEKLVLNALTTVEFGSLSAIIAAAELSAGTRRSSNVEKSTGLVISTIILPSSSSAYSLIISSSAL